MKIINGHSYPEYANSQMLPNLYFVQRSRKMLIFVIAMLYDSGYDED